MREPLYSQEHPPVYTIAVCTIVINAARNYRRVAHLLLAQILNRHPPALQLVAAFNVTALHSQLRLVLQLFIPLSQGISVPWVSGRSAGKPSSSQSSRARSMYSFAGSEMGG